MQTTFLGREWDWIFLCFYVMLSHLKSHSWEFPPQVWSPFVQPGLDITFGIVSLTTSNWRVPESINKLSTINQKYIEKNYVTSYSYVTWMRVLVYSSKMFFGTDDDSEKKNTWDLLFRHSERIHQKPRIRIWKCCNSQLFPQQIKRWFNKLLFLLGFHIILMDQCS